MSIVFFIVYFILRVNMRWAFANVYDTALVVSGVLVLQNIHLSCWLRKFFSFFGKYSMDMFLTHNFLLSLWPFTHNIVYATRNPLLIYLTLLAMSVLLAMMLGKIRELTGFNRLVARLRNSN